MNLGKVSVFYIEFFTTEINSLLLNLKSSHTNRSWSHIFYNVVVNDLRTERTANVCGAMCLVTTAMVSCAQLAVVLQISQHVTSTAALILGEGKAACIEGTFVELKSRSPKRNHYKLFFFFC